MSDNSQLIADKLSAIYVNAKKFTVNGTDIKTYINNKIAETASTIYKFRGSVDSYDDLPTSGNSNGDVWNVKDTGMDYAWISSSKEWNSLGGQSGGGSSDLTAQNISIEDYAALLSSGTTLSNCLYVVSSDSWSCFGEKLQDVGEPELSSDAATKNYVDSHSGGGEDYFLVSCDLRTCGSGLSCQLSNYTISTVRISDPSIPVSVILPRETENSAVRDFMIRFENTGSVNANVAFVPYNLESVDFEGADEDWSTIEPGVNLLSFTETKRD